MSGVPCPACRQPLGLTLQFIIQNPKMACPYCKTVMDFKVNDEIKQQLNSTLAEIEKIKSEYKGTVKFG